MTSKLLYPPTEVKPDTTKGDAASYIQEGRRVVVILPRDGTTRRRTIHGGKPPRLSRYGLLQVYLLGQAAVAADNPFGTTELPERARRWMDGSNWTHNPPSPWIRSPPIAHKVESTSSLASCASCAS